MGILLSLLLSGCPKVFEGGGAVESRNVDSATDLWARARAQVQTSYPGAVQSDGRQLTFTALPTDYLSGPSGRGALLEIVFEKGTVFSLNGFDLALNGINGSTPPYFDLSAVSSWGGDGGTSRMYVGLDRLVFENGMSFTQKVGLIQGNGGTLSFWLKCPQRAVAARLLLYLAEEERREEKRPEVVFDQRPDEESRQSTATFQFHSADHPSGFQCALDSESFSVCRSPAVYTKLSAGRHQFEVRALDAQGAPGPESEVRFRVVPAIPAVTITQVTPAGSPNNSRALTVSFKINYLHGEDEDDDDDGEEGDAVASAHGVAFCQLDLGKMMPCQSPVTIQGLGEGTHSLQIGRRLNRGRYTPVVYTWVVDLTPPRLQWVSTPLTLTNASSTQFVFSSDEPSAFSCTLDGEAPLSCTSPQDLGSLADGTHRFTVTATDLAGNVSAPLTYSWTIDTTPPVVFLGSANPAQSPTNHTALSLSFTVSEAAGFTCQLDGGTAAACSSPVEVQNLADGAHRLSVVATDLAGNASAPQEYDWVVDTSAPVLSLRMVSPAGSPTNSTSAQFAIGASETEGVSLSCSLDGAAYAPCGSTVTVNGLGAGNHVFQAVATDAAGNLSAPAAFSWTIDLTPPVVQLTATVPSQSVTSSRSMEIDFQLSKPATATCALDQAGPAVCTSPFLANGLADGQHTLVIGATDAAGNQAAQVSYGWTVATSVTVSIDQATPGATLTSSTTISFAFSSTDTQQFMCSLDGAPPAACTSPKSYGGLTNGNHLFSVQGVNAAGGPGPAATYQWTVDTTPPAVSIVSTTPSASPTNSRSISIAFAANKVSTFRCTLDAGAASACASPYTASALLDGTHSFSVTGTDQLGNTSAPVTYSWTVDTSPPVVTLTAETPSGNPTNSTTMSIAFTSSKAGSRFSCVLDAGVPAGCVSPYAVSALGNGSHTVAVTATDAAGNTGAAASYSWSVDTTPPVVTIAGTTPSKSPTNVTSMSVVFSANKAGVTYTCVLDGLPASCASPYAVSALASGSHTITITARDAAGNASAPASYTWTVDTTPPMLTLTSETPSANPTNVTTMSIAFAANKPSVTFSCTLDGVASPCLSPFAASALANGNHAFALVGTDLAGNTSAPISYNWTVDTTPPTVTIAGVSPSANPTNITSISIAFNANKVGVIFTCSLDGTASVCTSPFTASALSSGNHSVAITGKDTAGNTSAMASYGWTIDTTPPVVTLTGETPSTSPTNSTTMSVAFTSSKAGSTFSCALDAGAPSGCVSPYAVSLLTSGSHTISITARDAAGNTSAAASYGWTVDTTPPVVTLTSETPSTSPTNSTTMSVAFTSSKAGSTFSCALDASAPSGCVSPYAVSLLTSGSHTISITARDAAGNTSAAASYSWTVDTTPPVVTLTGETPSTSPTNSTTMSVAFTSSKAGSTFSCVLDAGAPSGCISPYAVSALGDGGHTISITARDAAGNTSAAASYSWIVDTTPPVVTLTSETPSTSPTNRATMAIAFSVSKSGSTTKCQLDALSATSCTSPYSLSGLGNGSHTVTIVATDAYGLQGAATYSWTVDTTPPVVTIGTANPSASPTNVTSMSLAFSASKPSNFVCSLDGGVGTACASPYAVSGLADGSHSISVTATDSLGNTGGPASYGWVVDTVAPTVTLISETPPYSPTSNTSMTVTFNASEPSTFLCQLDAGAWLSCSSPYTVTGLGNGTHTISITATDAAGNTSAPASYTWVVNTSALTITGLTSSQVTSTSARINWTTNFPATSQVIYGVGSPTQSTAVDGNYVTSHSIVLSNLTPGSSYKVEAKSTDRDGRTVTSNIITVNTPF